MRHTRCFPPAYPSLRRLEFFLLQRPPNPSTAMKSVRCLSLIALACASLSLTAVLRAQDFVVDAGSSESEPVIANRVVLLNQTGQPKLKIFISAKPGEKPQPQPELTESDYTVKLAAPTTEVSLYVATMDNKKKSAIRRAKDGDVLAVVFQDGGIAVLKHRTSRK